MGVAVPTFAPNATVRYRRKAPIHERIYFWSGGRIAVGGSPSTFGESPLRIARLREAEIAEWRRIFEAEWRSPLYTALTGLPLARGPRCRAGSRRVRLTPALIVNWARPDDSSAAKAIVGIGLLDECSGDCSIR